MKSLVYGSDDAGATVFASDPKVNRLMEIVLGSLHLKPHYAGLVPPTEENIANNKVL
jgi:hypothetical protein